MNIFKQLTYITFNKEFIEYSAWWRLRLENGEFKSEDEMREVMIWRGVMLKGSMNLKENQGLQTKIQNEINYIVRLGHGEESIINNNKLINSIRNRMKCKLKNA